MPLENAHHAIRVMISAKELVYSPLQTIAPLLMLAVKSGTGLQMLAVNALNFGSLLMVFAHLFQLFVNHSMQFQETVLLATQVTIFSKVLVFIQAQTLLLQAIQDVKLGLKEFVNNALKTGLSMIKESVLLFLISAKLVKDLPALAASMDMFLAMELASSHL